MGKLPTVLENIVATRKEALPEIRARIRHVNPQKLLPSHRSLYQNLGKPGGPHFIMECKSASPSLGTISTAYHPGQLAQVYSKYAAGISVLCEPERFHGDYDHLATVAASTHLPVLCKDFIIDEIQIYAARYFGADAILLMLSVLDDATYTHLQEIATALDLDILTEVISEDELDRAQKLGAKIIGINNRNLHDLSIDLNRTKELAPQIPEGIRIISESGIQENHTVRDLAGYCDGFLVGSHLSGAENTETAARSLLYGENKVCGLQSAAAAQVAAASGAVYGGLIRVPESPRYVSRETSEKIMAAEPSLHYVLVTRETENIRELLSPGIAAVQLHAPYQGSIAAEQAFIRNTKQALAAYAASQAEVGQNNVTPQIWRAISMSSPEGAHSALALADEVDHLVLDAHQGGSGRSFDWEDIPRKVKSKSFLAGGLHCANIMAALEQDCHGLDINSGVEYPATNGSWQHHKDAHQVRHILAQIRSFRQAPH